MRETTSLILLFLFGCIGLFMIYGHQRDKSKFLDNTFDKSITRYIHKIQYYPQDEHCVEVFLTQEHKDVWLDFGNGQRHRCTEEKASFRYKDAGLFTIRAYHNDKLVDMDQLDPGAF